MKVLPAVFILLTLVGIFNNYTSVPQADMWSNFELIYEFEKQNYAYLFSQHNEHRILFPRLIYLLDYYLFNDGYYLLYFLNIFLFFLIVFMLRRFFNESSIEKKFDSSLFLFSFSILFFWGQKANFIWAYQSQFLLAYILPMASIYYASKINQNFLYIYVSVLFGSLGILTMANGLFTFPIIFIYLALNKLFYKSLIFLFLSLLSFLIYFHNYSAVENHTNYLTLLSNLDAVLLFYFTLCGNFTSFIVGKGSIGIFVASLFGVFLNLGLIYILLTKFRSLKSDFLFFVVLFLIISLISIATGRVEFGLKASISSRYITPSIILFCVLIFYFYKYSNINLYNLRRVLIFTLILLIPYQLSALKNKDKKRIEDFSEVISFMMAIDNKIPHFDELNQTKYFLDNNILIFSNPIIKSATDYSDNFSCKLKKINNYKINEINNSWSEVLINNSKLISTHYKLYDHSGIYKGFIFNLDLPMKLSSSDEKRFFGYVKNPIKNIFYCPL